MEKTDFVSRLDNMLTVAEVAVLLHVHPNTLRRWADKGFIEFYRINSRGDRRFMPNDVFEFINNQYNYNNHSAEMVQDTVDIRSLQSTTAVPERQS